VLHAARWKYTTQKNRQKFAIWAPSHNFIRLSLRIKACIDNRKELPNNNISSTCPHNMVNVGPLTAEIGSPAWGTPANFNGFRVLPSLLQRRRSLQANQTLHDAWPSPALIHYIIINMHFWRHLPLTEFCPVQNSLYVQVLRSSILAALLHGTPAAGVSQTLRRGTRNGVIELSQRRHLYSAGRTSRWASAHILVLHNICSTPAFSNSVYYLNST